MKVNIVSHFLPVSVWSIISREIILLPAELLQIDHAHNVFNLSVNDEIGVEFWLGLGFLPFALSDMTNILSLYVFAFADEVHV